ncbi:MAG TPA: CheR family methyltransferase, partial [Pararobbsia sp.]|nr:CheR family methyltransferase [Pararobbsia sp.]
MTALSDAEFARFQRFIYDAAGITLSHAKKAMVCGRLSKRLAALRLASFSEYLEVLFSGEAKAEVQIAIDLLTTNETYFFRETKHFDLLATLAQSDGAARAPFRIWSAACSSGEEPYSMAMVLADRLGERAWDVVATDISSRVLRRAQTGHYPLERTRHIPPDYLKRFCLRGIGEQEGTLLVARPLRQR